MRDCDRREDSDDRQRCRNKCYDSMFESDHFNRDSMSDSGHFDREDGFERSYGSGDYEMCMRDCDRRENSDDRQRCRSRCSDSMSGSYDSYRASFNMQNGWGNFDMCMRDCDRREDSEDSEDRQRCRNRCFHSTSGSYDSYPGSFNTEEALASSYGRGNFETCMQNCDRREDSDDRQMCRNRCFDSMSGSYPGSFNKEKAIGSRNFQMSRCM